MLGGAAKQVNVKKRSRGGPLEGRTTPRGSSAPPDGSQGKLKAEKIGEKRTASFEPAARSNQVTG
jgi:hypothetical protein